MKCENCVWYNSETYQCEHPSEEDCLPCDDDDYWDDDDWYYDDYLDAGR